MKPTVRTIKPFDKQAKALSKKYPSFKDDLKELTKTLEENPEAGYQVIKDIYKIRMAIKSKNKGKSGGASVIFFNIFAQRDDRNEIIMLSIYDKSDQESISDKEIRDALKEV